MADPFTFIIQQAIPDPRDQQSFSGLNFTRNDLFPDETSSISGTISAIPIIIGEDEDNEQYHTPEQILPSISEELRNEEEVPRDAQIDGDDDEGISSRSEFVDINVVDDSLNGVSVNGSVDNVPNSVLAQNMNIGEKNETLMNVEEIDVMSKCNATTISKAILVGSGGTKSRKTLESNHLCRDGGSYSRGDDNGLRCGKELEGKVGLGERLLRLAGGRRFDMGPFSVCRSAREEGPSASMENVQKRFVTVDDLLNGDDDNDILVVAIKAGMKFPRPRWWGPEGYGKGRKDNAS